MSHPVNLRSKWYSRYDLGFLKLGHCTQFHFFCILTGQLLLTDKVPKHKIKQNCVLAVA
jgi:hypothetical protein